MTRDKLLEELRKLYIKKDIKEFRRKYLFGFWLLTDEDRKKIEAVMPITSGKQQSLVDLALEIMPGSKIIE